jgi:protein-disulfide isomerase
MEWMRRIVPALVLLLASVVASVEAQPATQALAEVDGVAITAEEVDKAIGEPIRKLEEQITNLRRQKIQAMINDRLLAGEAARRGMSIQALLDAEVTSQVGLVTEQEIEQTYQARKGQADGDEAAARDEIRTRLQNEKLAARRRAFLDSLRAQAQVVVHLPAPTVHRIPVTTNGGPAKGSANAPVVIVKFEDFHCPFCKRIQARLEELRVRYPDQIRLVHRDFPLDKLHQGARSAHEAARCAEEQGKFWEYHDLLYANAPKASPEQLQGYAQQVGLEVADFTQCLASGKHKAEINRDLEDGRRFGVTGTPHFFVNGRSLIGAQPIEKFVALIEEELAEAKTSK